MARNQPSFQFYPGDWLKDPALNMCSLAAKGALIDLICLSYGMPKPGVFVSRQKVLTIHDLARMLNEKRTKNVKQLIENGVLRIAVRTGRIYHKRIVMDELQRKRWARRQRRHRNMSRQCHVDCHADVTTLSHPSSSSSSSSLTPKSPKPPSKGIGKRKGKVPPTPPSWWWDVAVERMEGDRLLADDFKAAWREWCCHRHAGKRPFTQRAAKIHIGKLEGYAEAAGNVAAAVMALENSIQSEWPGVYPPNKPNGGRRVKGTGAQEVLGPDEPWNAFSGTVDQ